MFPFSQNLSLQSYMLQFTFGLSHAEYDLGKNLNTTKDIYVQQINFLLYLCSTDQRNQFKRRKGCRYIIYVVCVKVKVISKDK